MKKLIGTLIIVIVLLSAITGCAVYYFLTPSVYYTQIDNSKTEVINTNGGVINFEGSLPYKYTLTCYDKSGKEADISFTASRELRSEAFVRLENRAFRGVIGWEEVGYDELPSAVREKYSPPQTDTVK